MHDGPVVHPPQQLMQPSRPSRNRPSLYKVAWLNAGTHMHTRGSGGTAIWRSRSVTTAAAWPLPVFSATFSTVLPMSSAWSLILDASMVYELALSRDRRARKRKCKFQQR
jgi:hypothetical protein